MMNSTRILGAAVALCCLSGAAHAQEPVTNTAAALGGNVIIGGLTAAVRAVIEHKDPARAFGIGAFGGAMHFAGKYVASRRGTLSAWTGTAIAATGSSIVSNAGAGAAPLVDMYLPIGPLRVRFHPSTGDVRLGVNVYESAMIVRYATRPGLRVDWRRSAQTGTLVTNTLDLGIIHKGERVDGLTVGPVIVLAPDAQRGTRTWKHETVHVEQNWFMQEAWGRPIETALRRVIPGGSHIPAWLELGMLTPLLSGWQRQLFGARHGLENLMEAEAELLERPRRVAPISSGPCLTPCLQVRAIPTVDVATPAGAPRPPN